MILSPVANMTIAMVNSAMNSTLIIYRKHLSLYEKKKYFGVDFCAVHPRTTSAN